MHHPIIRLAALISLLIMLLIVPVFLPSIQARPAAQVAPADQSLQGTTIRFGTANREADPFDRSDAGSSRLASLLGRAGANVQMLNWEVPIPASTDLVVLVGPARSYAGYQVARLWAYLQNGGKLLILTDPPPIVGNALQQDSGIFELLWVDFGVRGGDYALVDPVRPLPIAPDETENEDGTPFPTPTAIPAESPPGRFGGLQTDNAAHPILSNVTLENLVLDVARPVEIETYTENSLVDPLLYTDDSIYGESDAQSLAAFGVYHFDNQADRGQQPFLIAAASEHRETGARVVVIGDADWGRNAFGFSTSPPGSEALVFPDTVQLILNAVYWLLIDQPAPALTVEAAAATPTPTPTVTPTLPPSPTPATDDAGDTGDAQG